MGGSVCGLCSLSLSLKPCSACVWLGGAARPTHEARSCRVLLRVRVSQAAPPCPPGKEFYEEIDGRKYKFMCWVRAGNETKAKFINKGTGETFLVPATAKDRAALSNRLGQACKQEKVRAESTRIYSNLLESTRIYSNLL